MEARRAGKDHDEAREDALLAAKAEFGAEGSWLDLVEIILKVLEALATLFEDDDADE